MINKRVEDITISDIEQLIVMGVAESKTIEYKRELPIPGDKGSVDILREITALANTSGGDLIYGVDAKDGVPMELVGCDGVIEDKLRLRIESLCREGVQPKLSSPQVKLLKLAGDSESVVILLRIEPSWISPHRVSSGKHNQFYGRSSVGCFQMDVEDLRQAFLVQSNISERVRKFREERLESIFNNTGPHPMLFDGGKLVVHVMPIVSLSRPPAIDMRTLRSISPHLPLLGVASSIATSPALEGMVTSGYVAGGERTPEYVTSFYRNGLFEAIAMVPNLEQRQRGHQYIHSTIQGQITGFVEKSAHLLRQLEISMPFAVGVSLVQITGYHLIYPVEGHFIPSEPISGRAFVVINDCWVEDIDEIDKSLKSAFQIMWNAFGVD